MSITQICSTCGEEKELEYFHVNVRGLHGRKTICAECCNAYGRASKSKREWQDSGGNSLYRTTLEEESAYPSRNMDRQQAFIYNR